MTPQDLQALTYVPCDPETERLFLSAAILAAPGERRSSITASRPAWFYEPWHREVYDGLWRYRDYTGVDLVPVILTAEHRAKWPGWFDHFRSLFRDRAGESIGGFIRDWQRYASRLERIAALRQKLFAAFEALDQAVEECLSAERT